MLVRYDASWVPMDRAEQPCPSVAPLSLGAGTQGWGPSEACTGPRDGKPAPSWAMCEARCQHPKASLKLDRQTRCFIKPQQGKKKSPGFNRGAGWLGVSIQGVKAGLCFVDASGTGFIFRGTKPRNLRCLSVVMKCITVSDGRPKPGCLYSEK